MTPLPIRIRSYSLQVIFLIILYESSTPLIRELVIYTKFSSFQNLVNISQMIFVFLLTMFQMPFLISPVIIVIDIIGLIFILVYFAA